MQTREILSWFGPRDLRPVPKQPLEIFLILILYTQNQLLVHHLTKQHLSNMHNSSLHQEDNNLYNFSSTPRRHSRTTLLFERL